jgi:hypothetical protein
VLAIYLTTPQEDVAPILVLSLTVIRQRECKISRRRAKASAGIASCNKLIEISRSVPTHMMTCYQIYKQFKKSGKEKEEKEKEEKATAQAGQPVVAPVGQGPSQGGPAGQRNPGSPSPSPSYSS